MSFLALVGRSALGCLAIGAVSLLIVGIASGGGESSVSDRGDGIAIVSEGVSAHDAGRYTGRFDAHWESHDGDQIKVGPRDVSVDEAIRWGRMHSDRVLVRLGGEDGQQYSAGSVAVNDLGTLKWPKEGLRIEARPEGATIDGSEQLVAWRADIVFDCPIGLSKKIARIVSSRDSKVQLRPLSGSSFRSVVLARGSQDAAAIVRHAVDSAYVAVGGSEPYAPVSISGIERADPLD